MKKFVRDGHNIGIMIYEAEITDNETGVVLDKKLFLREKSAEKMYNKMSAQIHYNDDDFTASYGGEVLWII